MPRDYSKGKLYMIWSPSHPNDPPYYGSTIQSLSLRMGGHRAAFKRWRSGKLKTHCSSFEVLRHGDAKIELVALCPCPSKYLLHRAEGQLQRSRPCVNKTIAGRTPGEWLSDNYDKVIEQQRQLVKRKREEREKQAISECFCGWSGYADKKDAHLKSLFHILSVEQIHNGIFKQICQR